MAVCEQSPPPAGSQAPAPTIAHDSWDLLVEPQRDYRARAPCSLNKFRDGKNVPPKSKPRPALLVHSGPPPRPKRHPSLRQDKRLALAGLFGPVDSSLMRYQKRAKCLPDFFEKIWTKLSTWQLVGVEIIGSFSDIVIVLADRDPTAF
jgi:hypothetical protein